MRNGSGRLEKWKKPALVGVCVFLLAMVGIATWVYWRLTSVPPPSTNELALGDAARFQGARDVALNPPVELDFKTQAEVLDMRKAWVEQHAELLSSKVYKPYEPVFGDIVDGKPWWGIEGEYYWGPGKDSIRGASEETRLIANPFLLVGLDLGYVRWCDWASASDVSKPDFPFTCLPSKMAWNPAARTVDVTYPYSKFTARAGELAHRQIAPSQPAFPTTDVYAYNARDFGLNYIYIDPERSTNIESRPMKPIYIRHFIHCGGSCGYPGGCNNMSPYVAELDNLRVIRLPASLVVKLWKGKPTDASERADMTCTIHLD